MAQIDDTNVAAQGLEGGRRQFVSAAITAAGMAVAATALAGEHPTPAAGRLPANTPISKLGFNAAEVGMMTPATQKLTKGDLMELQKWGRSGGGSPPLHLTIADIQSLEKAYQTMDARQHKPGGMSAQDVTACCCCSPCCTCTAAAEVRPVRVA